MLLACVIGVTAYFIKTISGSPIADPLLVAMIIGIVIRAILPRQSGSKLNLTFATMLFIPIGIPFYAVKNLNFVKFAKIETSMLILLVVIMLVYFLVILLLGRVLKLKKEITYLTATGSAICGASAITITAPAVKAKSDDISISLLSVAVAGLVALFVILPFCATALGLSNKTYGSLSGAILQFTGFVKAAVHNAPYLSDEMPAKQIASMALSLKAARYLGLLIAIPLFASLVQKKFHIPWILWLFLISGVVGTSIYTGNKVFYTDRLIPAITPVYNISWAIAMAAIGLNADIRELLSNNGTKALIVAFSGFAMAVITFFVGLKIIHIF